MPNPYQRGTDIEHCPKECVFLKLWADGVVIRDPILSCTATRYDTCPREQAEKPVEYTPLLRCETCIRGVLKLNGRFRCDQPDDYPCDYWERTNG